MKSMYHSLIDYEMGQLQAIARCRDIPLTTSHRAEAVARLTEALLSPAAVAIALADLPESEQAALRQLVGKGGHMESPRFTRQYGEVRPMGTARLEREKPWQNPANPTEGLWYRGFIFKAFQLTALGSMEMVYIPTDLLPLLQTAPAVSAPADWPALTPMPPPAVIAATQHRLRENVFNLLIYLQTTPVRTQPGQALSGKDKADLRQYLLPPTWSGQDHLAELDFLLHLTMRAKLLVISHHRLRPDRDPARAWLQASAEAQNHQLQLAWRSDPTWNELWRVPGLVMQPTGWENSPLLARSKFFDILVRLIPATDTWILIDDFAAAVKRLDPDFQRPGGDYQSWYIYDQAGQSLMGFEHWERVEGALLRYWLTGLLPWLGMVDLGLADAAGPPTSFRLTTVGRALLSGQPAEATSPGPAASFLLADNDFGIHVPGQASLYDRFQLARFAAFERRDGGRVVYRITQASVGRALRNGVTADQMVTFLARATNNRTPLKVVEALHGWGRRRSTVKIEKTTLLRVTDPALVVELRNHPDLNRLLGEVIGPQSIIISPEQVSQVRKILIELGYLE